MPKAARRQSGPQTVSPRSKPYPAIKPGDKLAATPTDSNSSKTSTSTPANTKKVSPNPTEKKEAASDDKPSSFLDIELDGNCPM